MKANDAWICMSCEDIYDASQHGYSCPTCAKGPTYPIFDWVNKRLAAIRQAEAYIKEQNKAREGAM